MLPSHGPAHLQDQVSSPSSSRREKRIEACGKVFYELGQEEGLITSAHVPLTELSHMTTLTARDAGKYSQAVCPGGRGSGFGEHSKPSSSGANFPGPSNGPASLKFLDTAHSAKTTTKKDSSALGASSLFPRCAYCSMDILAQVAFFPFWIWLSQWDFQG